MNSPRLVLLAILLVLSSCSDSSRDPDPTAPPAPSAAALSAGCPESPDFVVADEASLIAALDQAVEGERIAIQGIVTLTATALMDTDGVTLTCASAGSGLTVAAAASADFLVRVEGDRVTIERLVLDAEDTGRGAVSVGSSLPADPVEDVRFTGNEVSCGPGNCVGFAGAPRAVVSDNLFTAPHPTPSGVHLQGRSPATFPGEPHLLRVDGSIVERNVIVATQASPPTQFGGIRVRDGSDVTIRHNVVRGAWWHSLALSDLADSEISHNLATGAGRAGIVTHTTRGQLLFRGNVVVNNRVNGAGAMGMEVRQSCLNLFQGNELAGNGPNVGAVFLSSTGANTLRGYGGIVFDDGSADCDGDGTPDPNAITGHGPLGGGAD